MSFKQKFTKWQEFSLSNELMAECKRLKLDPKYVRHDPSECDDEITLGKYPNLHIQVGENYYNVTNHTTWKVWAGRGDLKKEIEAANAT